MLFPGFPGIATAIGLFALIRLIILVLAAGLVGSLNFKRSSGRSLKPFASPLFLVAMSITYGVLFMILLALNFEYHLHHPNDSRSYTRFQYTRNQSRGFGALVCFCISYMWPIAVATR